MKGALELAVEAALAAGKIQSDRKNTIGTIRYKGEVNPVTEIDLLCEQEIIGRIKKKFPNHAILAEESGVSEGSAVFKWIIDPLDGTINYAHGFPCYCVSIGLEHEGEMVLGVIYNPSLDELFVAEKGKGATLNSEPISVSSIENLKQSLLVTGFSYDVVTSGTHDNIHHFANFTKACEAVRRPGSACLDLVYTAAGRFEGFWEMKLNPWDVAAGSLIVQEAGGTVTCFDGSPFNVYAENILASNGRVHQDMVDVLMQGERVI